MAGGARVRLGFTLTPSQQIDIPEIVELAVIAESLGYESVWIPETWGIDAVTVLAVLARETKSIKVAAGVFNVFSRSAALIAQTSATLSNLTHGRFILGLGASGPAVVENWHGMTFSSPLERTDDYVRVIRSALAGERVDVEGATLSVKGFRLQNVPNHPIPIYIAALGPRNVRLTAEIADGWLPIFAPRGFLRDAVRSFREEAGYAHRGVAAFIPAAVSERGETLLRQQLAYYIGGMGTYYARFMTRMGLADQAAAIRDAWLAGDRREAVRRVRDDLLDVCTLGTEREEAIRRLTAYQDEGVDLPIVALPRGITPAEAITTLERLGPASGGG